MVSVMSKPCRMNRHNYACRKFRTDMFRIGVRFPALPLDSQKAPKRGFLLARGKPAMSDSSALSEVDLVGV